MKFQGTTHPTNNPTVRDLAHKTKLYVEHGTYRSPAHLQNSIIDTLVPWGWPADAKVTRQADLVDVHVNEGARRICVLTFKHKLGGVQGPVKATDLLIKVRRTGVDQHVATAPGGLKATSTSSHANAATALVKRFLGAQYKPVRAQVLEKKYHDPNREPWQQLQVYRVEKA